MTLRHAVFHLSATSVIAGAVAVPAIWTAAASHATTPTHIAVIGDSYTAGSDDGGGSAPWTDQAWMLLSHSGIEVEADVAAEGGAGYGQPGERGSVFSDLAARAVHRDDALVVFFGSRDDQPVSPATFTDLAAGAFHLARFVAPDAHVLVIGPAWPSSTPPPPVLAIRAALRAEAKAIGATFVDPIAEDWFAGRPDLISPDGVRPTAAGHAYLAQKIAPLILGQLTTRI